MMVSSPISYTEWKMSVKALASLYTRKQNTSKIKADNSIMTWLVLSIKIQYWLPSFFLPLISFLLPSHFSKTLLLTFLPNFSVYS